jgi:hypothetical protein
MVIGRKGEDRKEGRKAGKEGPCSHQRHRQLSPCTNPRDRKSLDGRKEGKERKGKKRKER